MPLGSPIGSNKGICTKEFIQILIDEIDLPIIVDAGIGKPSQACEAMEMGAAAVMANTAIATAGDIPAMAEAFKQAIEAGRAAYLAGKDFSKELSDEMLSNKNFSKTDEKRDSSAKKNVSLDSIELDLTRSRHNSLSKKTNKGSH